jgi:pyrimidine operon attenuation protein/uracil phosphoribosyltransferase
MNRRLLLDKHKLEITLNRLCFQLLENHDGLNETIIVGLQPRGVFLARRIVQILGHILPDSEIRWGELDVTFYRDDFRRREMVTPSATRMDVNVENKKVVLIDDVLYTGRTIRAGMDALIDFGRPASVELLVLVDRRYSRQLPIAPDYIGISVDTITSDKVKVGWQETDAEEGIWLIEPTDERTSISPSS